MTTSTLSSPRPAGARGAAPARPTPAAIAARIGAAVLGGYAFTWGLNALGTAGFYALGMEFHDSEHLSAIIGFLVWTGIFLWAFAARRIARVWAILVVAALAMAGAASLVQRLIT